MPPFSLLPESCVLLVLSKGAKVVNLCGRMTLASHPICLCVCSILYFAEGPSLVNVPVLSVDVGSFPFALKQVESQGDLSAFVQVATLLVVMLQVALAVP